MFLGRELTSVTTHKYADGRLVETTTTHEAAWTDEDRDWLLAYLAEQAAKCPGCGQPKDECFDPERENDYRVEALRCYACAVAERERARLNDREKSATDPSGLHVIPIRR